jgi:hypothetical protein
MSQGYIMLQRSDATWELLGDPNAFIVLTVIALRARRTNDFSVHGLQTGQALIGDFEAYGLTLGQYRAAKARLERYGLAHFRGTNRGTIARLLSGAVYDINAATSQQANDKPATIKRQTDNKPATTNNNEKNEKKGKGPPSSCRSKGPKSFEQIDRERAAAALARAQEEFLADEQD